MNRISHVSLVGLASALALVAGVAQAQTADPAAQAPAGTPAPAPAPAADGPVVGGAPMSPAASIVDNASKSRDHTTLVAAVKAAELVPTLSGPGPFTVFAPTNEAFTRLAPGTVDTLMKPENKPTLVKVLTYQVVPGKYNFADLGKLSTEQGGTAKLTTVEGGVLQVKATADMIELTDENGNKAYVSQPDVAQSNGIIHVTNGVMLPKLDAPASSAGN
ncbi:putative surface protein with fasciclin (FAS1) repeats [Sphingomonas zeicaulis]|uniref:fasciclin domain-containing protein n=1 Tax=Sphingomonas zeicaulis TaxID=1632740 RepID=UPI003D2114AE